MYFIFSHQDLKASIGTNFVYFPVGKANEISLQNLALFPPFFRAHKMVVKYDTGSQSIADKCNLFDGCLNSIEQALNDTDTIQFVCTVSRNERKQFSNHQMLIEYIGHRFLPICNSSRRYLFSIRFCSNKNTAGIVIASILQMPQIIRTGCSHASFWLKDSNSIHLPIETISNWLTRNSVAEKQIIIFSSGFFDNAQEMCSLLETVIFYLSS